MGCCRTTIQNPQLLHVVEICFECMPAMRRCQIFVIPTVHCRTSFIEVSAGNGAAQQPASTEATKSAREPKIRRVPEASGTRLLDEKSGFKHPREVVGNINGRQNAAGGIEAENTAPDADADAQTTVGGQQGNAVDGEEGGAMQWEALDGGMLAMNQYVLCAYHEVVHEAPDSDSEVRTAQLPE
jgi:hypothetical protein